MSACRAGVEADECGAVASWGVFVSLGGAEFGPIARCGEHVELCAGFHLGEPSTRSVRVERLAV